jgi:hypothetical protein
MNKKIGFVLTLLFTGMLALNAQQLLVSFSRTYNPGLPLYGFSMMGMRAPITRNLTSTECLINTSTQKTAVESTAASNGIFTAKILLTMNGQNAVRLTFSLQSGTDGDYNYVTSVTLDNLITKIRTGPSNWDGSAGKAMELVGMVAGSLDIFYDTSLVYAENPAAEKKRLADAVAERQRQEAVAAQRREQEVVTQQLREEAQKTEITPEEEFKFGLTEDGEGIVITEYIGKRQYVNIPTEVQGFPVVEIGGSAFHGLNSGNGQYNDKIVSVIIPSSVKKIGEGAFVDCDNLVSVTIPDSVTEFKAGYYGMFQSCKSLTSVTLPAGLKEIPANMFAGCTALKSITIPMGVTVIRKGAFSRSGLTSITIPDSVTEIEGSGGYAFSECKDLTSVVLSKGIKKLEGFSGCTSLVSIVIPDGVEEIGSFLFSNCTNLTSVTIPSSVKKVGDYAFKDCKKLNLATQSALKKAGWKF